MPFEEITRNIVEELFCFSGSLFVMRYYYAVQDDGSVKPHRSHRWQCPPLVGEAKSMGSRRTTR